MDKQIAVFDLDDVIASTIDGIIQIVWENFQVKMELEDFSDFNFKKIPEVAKRAKELENLIRTEEFFIQRKILPGALKGLNILSEKYIIFISTARKRRLRKISLNWCKQVEIDPFIKKLYCGRHKPSVILREQADIFIDDNPYEHRGMFDLNHNLTQILIDRPWNKNFHDNGVIRSCGWIANGKHPTILDLMM